MQKQTQHSLNIGLKNKPPSKKGIVRCRKIALREKIMRWFFGELQRVMIIVPNDNICDITIQEVDTDDSD